MAIRTTDIRPRENGENGSETAAAHSFEQRISAMISRTPEQIAEARARVLAGSPEPRPLPPGKSLEEVIVGQLADDRSEAEVLAVLEELS